MKLLRSYMADIAKDCEPPSMAWFMKKPKPMMCCRKSLFRCGKKPAVIHPKLGNHSAGWSPSRGGVPSTDCDGVRLILVRESDTRDESSKSRKHRVAMPLGHSY